MDDEQGGEPVDQLTLDGPTPVRSRRPRALWAVLAVVGVVAGAVVVTSAGDDGGQVPGLPVDLAAASRAAGGGEGAAAGDSMLAWITYVPGDDLPALGGEAVAYRLEDEVADSQIRALADALGLDGDIETDDAGSWSVKGDDAWLTVNAFGGVRWAYGQETGECAVSDDGVERCSGSGVAVAVPDSSGGGMSGGCTDLCDEPTTTTATALDPCTANAGGTACGTAPCPPDADCATPSDPPAPPADLPSEAEARDIALELLGVTGFPLDGATVTVEGPYGAWFVTVEPRLDGTPSGQLFSVGVGPEGKVISASGVLGAPEALGSYPVLDTGATIDRANAQSDSFGDDVPAVGADDAVSSTTGGTDTGGTDDVDAPVTTVQGSTEPGTDPCAVPDGASDGCGGTTGCGGDGCVGPTTTIPCKVQPDGREICEVIDCASASAAGTTAGDDGTVTVQPCEGPTCPPAAPADGQQAGEPESFDCAPPAIPTDPAPAGPIEVVLVDAQPALVELGANDGSTAAYLVPAYRFTDADGGTVDLPAVADDALRAAEPTDVTEPAPVPVPEPRPCQVLEEQDPGTGTTHTVPVCAGPACPPADEGSPASCAGESLVVGEAYYVDIDLSCPGFQLGGRIWLADDSGEVESWERPGEPFEGGMFTLDAADRGTFVGDAAQEKVAAFHSQGPLEDPVCAPQPR